MRFRIVLRPAAGKVLALFFVLLGVALGSFAQSPTPFLNQKGMLAYEGPAEAVAFSPDGRWLAVANREKGLSVWEVATGKLRLKLEHSAHVSALAFDNVFDFHFDTHLLAFVGQDNKTIELWDVISGNQLHTLRGHTAEVYAIAFTILSNRIVSVGRDGTLKWWDMETGRELQSTQVGAMESAALNPSGRWLATKTLAGPPDIFPRHEEIKLWDIENSRLLHTIPAGTNRGVMAFSPDGRLLADTGSDWDPINKTEKNGIKIYNVSTGSELLDIPYSEDFRPASLAFDPIGRWLVVGQAGVTGPEGVDLWEVQTGQQLLHFMSDGPGSKFVALSPDGKWLALNQSDDVLQDANSIGLWDLSTEQSRRRIEGNPVRWLHSNQTPLITAVPEQSLKQSVPAPLLVSSDAAANAPRSQLAGHWVAVNRSQGGIGSLWEFNPDGTLIMSAGVIVDMPYRVEGDTLILPPTTTLPDAKPQVIRIRFAGDRLYEKLDNVPQEVSLLRTRTGEPGDPPIVGQWKPEPLAANQWKPDPSVANADPAKMKPEVLAKVASIINNNAIYTFTRDGTLKLRIAFVPVHGHYDLKNQTFSLDMPADWGEKRTVTAPFDLRDGKLYLTQPDGHTEDVYVKDDFEEAVASKSPAELKQSVLFHEHGPLKLPEEKPNCPVALPAPQLLAPADGEIFEHYPRYTTLVWAAVPMAAGYMVEWDYKHAKGWEAEYRGSPSPSFHTISPTFSFNFVGAQPGRWRVWAVDAQGNPGTKSEWREFSYTH